MDGEVLVGPGYREHGAGLPSTPFDGPAALWAEPLNKLYVQHPDLDDDALAKAAREAAGDLVTLAHGRRGHRRDAAARPQQGQRPRRWPPGGWRCAPPRRIAFGDMPNDIPMFAWAGHGVAMANAHPDLLSVADEVTSSNDEDGIALVLERLLGES